MSDDTRCEPPEHLLGVDGLISTAYDASANAITINRGTRLREEQRRVLGPLAEEIEAAEFLLAPTEAAR